MVAAGLELPPGLTVDNTIGALLLCIVVSVGLFGAICIQTYNYFNDYPDDRLHIKIVVIAVWSFECSHTVLILHALYLIMVSSFGAISFLSDTPWTLKASIIWSGLINSTVQSFFANRIRTISRKWTVPIICWILLLVRMICVIASSVVALSIKLSVFAVKFNWLLTILLIATFVVDVIVACAVAFYLARSRSGFMRTDRLVRRLILFSIETGLITSIVATVVLIIFLTRPHTFIWIGLLLILAKVYSNSLLYSLNARRHFRSDQSRSEDIFKKKTGSGSNANSLFQDHHINRQRNASQFGSVAIEMTTLRSTDFPPDQNEIEVEALKANSKQMQAEQTDSMPFQVYKKVEQ